VLGIDHHVNAITNVINDAATPIIPLTWAFSGSTAGGK